MSCNIAQRQSRGPRKSERAHQARISLTGDTVYRRAVLQDTLNSCEALACDLLLILPLLPLLPCWR